QRGSPWRRPGHRGAARGARDPGTAAGPGRHRGRLAGGRVNGAGQAPITRRLEERERLQVGTDIQRRLGIKTSRDEPLARFTTMRVGGRADLYAEVRNLFELRGIVRYARTHDLPLTLLGRGSDVVISD